MFNFLEIKQFEKIGKYFLGILLVGLFANNAFAQTFKNYGLRVSQVVSGTSNPVSTTSFSQVPLNFGSSDMVVDLPRTVAINSGVKIEVPFVAYGDGVKTPTEIIDQAKTILTPAVASGISQKLLNVLAQSKLGSAVFTFEQAVVPIDKTQASIFGQYLPGVAASSPRKLQWSITVIDGGRVVFDDPEILDPEPTVLFVKYTSYSVASILPTSWSLKDAGILAYQLRTKEGAPLTDWVKFQTNGEYDEVPETISSRVSCIANRHSQSNCPTQYSDAKSVMSDTSSVMAIIDYAHKVQPASYEVTTSNGTEYHSYVQVSYDKREYSQSACTAGDYRNAGTKTYKLLQTIERFQITPEDANPILVSKFEDSYNSPVESFDLSESVPKNTPYLTNYVLDSYEPYGLISKNDVLGLKYLAPIVRDTTITRQNNLTVISNSSDMPVSWDFTTGSFAYGNANNTWFASESAYERRLVFNLKNKNLFSQFTLNNIAYDDYIMVFVNGRNVFVGPHPNITELGVYYDYRRTGASVCKREGKIYTCGSMVSTDVLDKDPLTGAFIKDPVTGLYKTHKEDVYVSDPDYGSFSICYGVFCLYDNEHNGQVKYNSSSYDFLERGQDKFVSIGLDLRPYLVNGNNSIETITMVGGKGDSRLTISAPSCIEE